MSDGIDWENYDTGPFCRHWGTPGDCDECKAEAAWPYRALAERAILALREFDMAGANELQAKLEELDSERD